MQCIHNTYGFIMTDWKTSLLFLGGAVEVKNSVEEAVVCVWGENEQILDITFGKKQDNCGIHFIERQ